MPERNDNEPDENDPAVLADSESIHTTAIGIIGGTAQVDVALPVADDDDCDDDDVVDGEVVDGESVFAETAEPIDAEASVAHERSDAAASESSGPEAGAAAAAADDADADAATAADADAVIADAADAVEQDDRGAQTSAGHDEPAAVDTPDEREDHDGADRADADRGESEDEVIDATIDDDAADAAAAADDDDASVDVIDADAAPAGEGGRETDAVPAAAVVATVVSTATVITGSVPTTRREAHQAAEQVRHATERVQVVRPAEPVLQARRIGDLEPGRESADLLTADRLLDPAQVVRAEPEGRWQRLVYTISRHRINLGDGKHARSRKELDRRISAPLAGGAKFVPVLSRKGGVGKTTVTTLLGMALADARDDRVIAIDANPDRGTLADRIGRTSGKTVRDLVRTSADVVGFNDLSSIVARDETRLDVLASDADPHVSEAFSDHDYENVAAIAAHYYSIVLTDTGTGIVHSVMGATLAMSDQIVVVAGLSVDEARLASETLTWLESNGFAEAVKSATVVLNTSRPGTPMVRADELETHFASRVRSVVRVPYDAHLAAGSAVAFRDLDPATREAARRLAASVVEGLRLTASAA